LGDEPAQEHFERLQLTRGERSEQLFGGPGGQALGDVERVVPLVRQDEVGNPLVTGGLGPALTQIGTDGGLLATPIRHEQFELAPAQRVDLIVDFSGYRPGTAVTLLNDFGDGAMAQVMRFVVGEKADDPFTVPDELSTIETLTAAQAVTTRTFRFQSGDVNHEKGWLIDGQPFSDAGWKDTIDLRPSEEAAIAVKFDGYAGKYVFHCHNLEHEDMAMMADFTTR
jgi:spore coat protein A